MATIVDGPVEYYSPPLEVAIGESWKPQFTARDGLRTSALPYGALQSLAASTMKGVLVIYKPDGTTNVTRDTSVSGEGEKIDSDSDGATDSVVFYIAHTVTAGWTAGTYEFDVWIYDAANTPNDRKRIAVGRIHVDTPASSGG